ncbi:hypothetical protein EJB05_15705 [Eragrostis curvula]|uniref:F-box domain-containing protein n=1 Tax=Eragrostis curvula TaxID=38414 RepID=A0A5J9VEM0_9POAL|nr:hypothetical protein EJB05_15705 [Eragrostis curvula]
MFDRMPPGKICKKAPAMDRRDSIEVLPDCVLEHILGFLPAPQAVQTCLLARCWRHLWKHTAGLHIACVSGNFEELKCVNRSHHFLDGLLYHRGGAPLETCEFTFSGLNDDDIRPNHWIHQLLMCQVRILKLRHIWCVNFELDDLPLSSRHLATLKLTGIVLKNSFCDFSNCPSLEHLEMATCYFWYTRKLSSKSLKRLSIINCDSSGEFRTLFYVPCLVSLRLDGHLYRAPVLESIPSLHEAFVRVVHENADGDCDDYSDYCEVEDCYSCHGVLDDNKCVLLEGLSEAENLTLISKSRTFAFERDLKQCPTFGKLKTLLLNESWCVAPNFTALTCILKHSPVLENLTRQLYSKGPKHKVEMIGRYHPVDGTAAISEHLKAIKIKCEVVDEKVNKVLKFLRLTYVSELETMLIISHVLNVLIVWECDMH